MDVKTDQLHQINRKIWFFHHEVVLLLNVVLVALQSVMLL